MQRIGRENWRNMAGKSTFFAQNGSDLRWLLQKKDIASINEAMPSDG